MAFQDLSGQKFGFLTALKVVEKNKKAKVFGNVFVIVGILPNQLAQTLKEVIQKVAVVTKRFVV